jgi:hypothetical protein
MSAAESTLLASELPALERIAADLKRKCQVHCSYAQSPVQGAAHRAVQHCSCVVLELLRDSQGGSRHSALVLQDAAGRVDALQEAPAQPPTRNVAALPPAQVNHVSPAAAGVPAYLSTLSITVHCNH